MLMEELLRDAEAKGIAKGEARGIVKGTVEERIKTIFLFLSKLGEIPEALRIQIQEEKDPETLQSYLEKTISAESMEEFVNSIKQ